MVASLSKSISKRVPSSALLPTLCDIWSPIYESQDADRIPTYFHLLKKSLHAAARSEVLKYLRPLFNVFMQAFTLHSNSAVDDAQVSPQFFFPFTADNKSNHF